MGCIVAEGNRGTAATGVGNDYYSIAGLIALSQVSFSAEERVIKGVIGPNGAGKTTAIKCLMGLHAQTSGKVHTLGFDESSPRQRRWALAASCVWAEEIAATEPAIGEVVGEQASVSVAIALPPQPPAFLEIEG